VVITALAPADLADGARITNGASAASSEPESNPDDNVSEVDVPAVRSADLSILKTGPTTPIVAGTGFDYTLVIDNAGPSDATGVVVTDALPAGTTFVAASSSAACSAVGSALTCILGSVPAADGPITLTVSVLTDSALPAGGVLENNAAVSGDEDDPSTANNTSGTTTDLDRESGLEIIKTDSADPAIAGTQLTYTITATNTGPSVIDNAVVSDVLPAGATFVAAASSPLCVEVAAGTIDCALGTVAVDDPQILTIVVDLGQGIAAGTQLTNSATIDGDSSDPVTTTEETTIERIADLAITKVADRSDRIAGEPVVYTLTVDNLGPSQATELVVSDMLPAGAIVQSANTTGSTDPATECLVVGALVTCERAALAAGATWSITIEVIIDPAVADGADFINNATITAAEPDPDTDNNSADDSGTIERRVDISIEKVAVDATATAGESFSWSVTVTNDGPSDASGVVVSDTLPPGVTFAPSASTSSCLEDPASAITCSIGIIPAGQSATVIIAGDVDPSVPADTILTNSASVAVTEPNDCDCADSSETSTPVVGEADLSLSKTSIDSPIIAGTSVSYELTVTNAGPSSAVAVEISDTLPAGLTFDGTLSDATCALGVTCLLGTIAAGESVTVVVTASVASDLAVDFVGDTEDGSIGEAGGPVVNTASVASLTPDPDPENNEARNTTPIDAEVNLSVAKVANSAGAVAGEGLSYTLTATNGGPSLATGVEVVDNLPTGAAYDADGSSATCAEAPVGTITCELVDLDVGDTDSVVVAVTLDAALGDGIELTNRASVTSTETNTNPDPTVELTTPIGTASGLSIDKAIDVSAAGPAVAGTPTAFSITISNAGPSVATGVTIVDELPAGMSFIASDSTDSCDAVGTAVTCSVDDLIVGASATVRIAVMLDATITGPLLNTATGAADGVDPVVDSEEVPVGLRSDLSLEKTPRLATIEVGNDVVWDIEVINDGPSVATDVIVVDVLPAGLTYVSAGSSTECGAVADRVTCDIGDLEVGGTQVLMIVTAVGVDVTAETLSNSATVDSATSDAVPAVGTIAITRPPEPDPDPLAFTGDNIRTLIGYATMLMVAGVMLVIATRRRRSHQRPLQPGE